MTKDEAKIINELRQVIDDLSTSMKQFKNDVNERIQIIDEKVIKQPLKLEMDFNNAINDVICKALLNQLTDRYNSPINDILNNIVLKNKQFIENAVEDAIKEFQDLSLKDEIEKQLIKSFVSDCINSSGGVIDKYFNSLKQDPIFRAKLNIAMDNLVSDLINEL